MLPATLNAKEPRAGGADAAAKGAPPEDSCVTFANGLQLIIREDHSAPVVSAQAWCRAGSVHEGAWLGAGLSHALEHMLFKGTDRRPPGKIDQEVQAVGGAMNAYTSFDRTVYWINTPTEGLPTAIDVLCDIFQSATLPPAELEKELDVIRREMDMGNDDPGRRSSRRLFETAYNESPYRFPIIGLPALFNQIDRNALVSYYREKYAPNNCFLALVGDFDADAVSASVEKLFGSATPRPMPPAVLPTEPSLSGPREASDEAPVELAHFHIAWHTPDLLHVDTPALDALAVLLGGGRSSRLHQNVREKTALAHSIHAWNYTPSRVGLFGVSGVSDGGKFNAARDAALAEVERVIHHGVTVEEVAKAVRQFLAGYYAARKTMEGQAQDLGGSWLGAHDLGFGDRYLEAVRKLTPSDLQRAAAAHLRSDRSIGFALLPRGARGPARAPTARRGETHVSRFELPNGLRLLVRPDRRLPLISVRAAFAGGLLSETASTAGSTALVARLLPKGAGGRSAEQIAEAIEALGGTLEPFSGNHSYGLAADLLSEGFDDAIQLLLESLVRPALPEGEFIREREAQLAAIRGQRDHLLGCAMRAMRRQLFGAQAYGLDAIGDEASVSEMTAESLRRHHADLALPGGAVIAVFGDVDPEKVRDSIALQLTGWHGSPKPWKPTLGPTPAAPSRSVEHRDKEQAVVAVGFRGTVFGHEDLYRLELLEEACSSMGSRLFARIRDELGLAYYVGASHFPGRIPGSFAFYCGTSPDHANAVESELQAHAAALRNDGLGEDELRRAKARVIGQKKIALQDQGALASQMALDELFGLGFDRALTEDRHYEAVTADQVRDAARTYLRSEASAVAVQLGRPA